MRIYIAADHGGFLLKNEMKEYLLSKDLNYEIIDLGANTLESTDDYPDFVEPLCHRLQDDQGSLGILICRSGIGMSITANKFKGIYAALCFTPQHAIKAKEHNNANVICIDADYGDFENHKKVIDLFLHSEFEGYDTRHGRRVKIIKEFESNNFK
jgi:ribose 5-phosphate isomerase B